jgi:hypothetical protein
MRLLQRDDIGNYSLTPNLPSDVPPYAILSHTWGLDEIVFADLAKKPGDWQSKQGFEKIEFCALQAKQDGLRYFWVDTCCIDKSDSIELQTAINSMFRWYRDAKRCYVYLPDVPSATVSSQQRIVTPWEDAFRQSRWFTRGWTLQDARPPKYRFPGHTEMPKMPHWGATQKCHTENPAFGHTRSRFQAILRY